MLFLYFYLAMEGVDISPFLDNRLLLLGKVNRHGAKVMLFACKLFVSNRLLERPIAFDCS